MKKCNLIFLCLFISSFTNIFYAQSPIPDNRGKKQPILIDDTHAESFKLAELKLTAIRASALNTINNLTDKQIKCIGRIEKCRDRKIREINHKLASIKTKLIEFQADVKNNENIIAKTTNEISKLAIDYQKTISKSSYKIRSKLTQNQRIEYDKMHKLSN